MVSSDLDELVGLANRIMVLREGQMAAPPIEVGTTPKAHFLSLFFPGGAVASSTVRV
jgi:ABC-type sugar transport system ATPase subunit